MNARCGIAGGAMGLALLVFASAGATVLQVPSAYPTIQAALDAAATGDVVQVAAGTYYEQLDIHTAVTLKGITRNGTRVRAPASLAIRFSDAGVDYRPVVYVHAAGATTIRDLTVDGSGQGAGNAHLVGIAFRDADGAVLSAAVIGIKESPLSAAANGTAILALDTDGAPRALTVNGVTLRDYQKCGLRVAGAGLAAAIGQNELTGPGCAGTLAAPDGIVVAAGALAVLTDNEIYDHAASGAAAGPDPRAQSQSAAIRLENADPGTLVSDNVMLQNDTGITAEGGASIGENFLLDNRYAGVVLRGGASSVDGCNIQGNHRVGVWVLGARAGDAAELRNLCLSGPGGDAIDPGVAGVHAWSAGTPLAVTVEHCSIYQWNVGLLPEGSAVALDVRQSSIVASNIAAYDNRSGGGAQDATLNWWGAPGGPAPLGSGDPVLGGNVASEPRRLEESDTDVTCGLQGRGSTVGPVAPTECIWSGNPCVEGVPIAITRTTNEEVRGFTITFTLNDNLALCGGLAGIHEGTYLSGLSGGHTHFEKHASGDAWVVDCALLGEPCGQTLATGTLFTIDVGRGLDGDGTGLIAVTSVTVRDCNNQPIAAAAGPAVEVTVDTEAPAAVADVRATQLKIGNDSDGTTKIKVEFTAPGDAAAVEVYRAPFGHYPEYDDAGGAAPGAPVAYPPAPPWALTGVTASGGYDEPAARDFWYYVVYTADACGNWSAVSNRTDGTLDYHLGDVVGGGDNLVGTDDISRLGSTYFKIDGDTGYFNDCDTGPTTDASVDGRPLTDSAIDFEDLMIVAMNYGLVGLTGAPPIVATLAPGEQPVLRLQVDDPADGVLVAHLMLDGNEAATKGIHAVVAYDPGALALPQVASGGLVASFFRSQDAGARLTIDAAAIGQGATLHGSGEVATIRFQALGPDPLPVLETADLRGATNRPIDAAVDTGETGGRAAAPETVLPLRTELSGIRPNPFTGTTEVRFSLASAQPVSLRIYDAAGRLIRTLQTGTLPAGEHRRTWDGRADDGTRASSGVYLCTFRAGATARSQKVFHYR
jgi:hypothetical protein